MPNLSSSVIDALNNIYTNSSSDGRVGLGDMIRDSNNSSWRNVVTVIDNISTDLPISLEADITIDGVQLIDENRVLFTALSSTVHNNKIYKVSNLHMFNELCRWSAVEDGQNEDGSAAPGDMTYVLSGTLGQSLYVYKDSLVWEKVGAGTVTGPGPSTFLGEIARFGDGSGTALQGSGWYITEDGNSFGRFDDLGQNTSTPPQTIIHGLNKPNGQQPLGGRGGDLVLVPGLYQNGHQGDLYLNSDIIYSQNGRAAEYLDGILRTGNALPGNSPISLNRIKITDHSTEYFRATIVARAADGSQHAKLERAVTVWRDSPFSEGHNSHIMGTVETLGTDQNPGGYAATFVLDHFIPSNGGSDEFPFNTLCLNVTGIADANASVTVQDITYHNAAGDGGTGNVRSIQYIVDRTPGNEFVTRIGDIITMHISSSTTANQLAAMLDSPPTAPFSCTNQDITYIGIGGYGSGKSIVYTVSPGPIQVFVFPNGINVQFPSGTTASQVKTALDNASGFNNVSGIITYSITGTGSNVQIAKNVGFDGGGFNDVTGLITYTVNGPGTNVQVTQAATPFTGGATGVIDWQSDVHRTTITPLE